MPRLSWPGWLSGVLRWRHSLFWTIVPAMFVTSCAAAAILMVSATFLEDTRLRQALDPAALVSASERVLRSSSALVTAAGAPSAACGDTLHVMAERILAEAMGDRTGNANVNGFQRASQAGRLVLMLRTAQGSVCRFPAAGAALTPSLQRQLRALTGPGTSATIADIDEVGDGWISAAAIAPIADSDARLMVGVHILSPWAKLAQPRSINGALAVFILSINALSALVLVLLLIRRIRRADAAATSWTLGVLSMRINDRGRDEFSRLTRKFDLMADAMANVILVKQALAAEQERNRVARDLHDSVKQRAFALNLRLSIAREVMAPQDPGAAQVEAALALTGQLQQDLSNIMRQLAAPTIAETGFRHALTDSVGAMLDSGDIACSIDLSEDDERLFASMPELAHQLSLITIEAVANALKHARCTRCTISGERSGNTYTWRIIDNGVGIAPMPDKPAGMGLSNMKMRATSLAGGSFDIHPAQDGGTAIVITFELEHNH